MKTHRWQDWLNLLLGAWLFASPWVLGYSADLPKAATSAYFVGGAIAVLAIAALAVPRAWEEIITAVLGIWTGISPWVLGFGANKNVMLNAVIVGVLVAFLALWATLKDKDFSKQSHIGHAT